MKKIVLVFVLSILLISCGDNNKQEKQIVNNIESKTKKVSNVVSKKVNDIELGFTSLSRKEQIKKIKNISCDTFKSESAKRDCMHSKGDIKYDNFLKLSNEEKEKFDCEKFKENLKEYPALGVLFNRCISSKERIKKNKKQSLLTDKVKNGDFSYCEDEGVKKKNGFTLDNCKIGVVVKSDKKDCSVLDKTLVSKCEDLKSYLIEEEKKQKIINDREKILDLVN